MSREGFLARSLQSYRTRHTGPESSRPAGWREVARTSKEFASLVATYAGQQAQSRLHPGEPQPTSQELPVIDHLPVAPPVAPQPRLQPRPEQPVVAPIAPVEPIEPISDPQPRRPGRIVRVAQAPFNRPGMERLTDLEPAPDLGFDRPRRMPVDDIIRIGPPVEPAIDSSGQVRLEPLTPALYEQLTGQPLPGRPSGRRPNYEAATSVESTGAGVTDVSPVTAPAQAQENGENGYGEGSTPAADFKDVDETGPAAQAFLDEPPVYHGEVDEHLDLSAAGTWREQLAEKRRKRKERKRQSNEDKARAEEEAAWGAGEDRGPIVVTDVPPPRGPRATPPPIPPEPYEQLQLGLEHVPSREAEVVLTRDDAPLPQGWERPPQRTGIADDSVPDMEEKDKDGEDDDARMATIVLNEHGQTVYEDPNQERDNARWDQFSQGTPTGDSVFFDSELAMLEQQFRLESPQEHKHWRKMHEKQHGLRTQRDEDSEPMWAFWRRDDGVFLPNTDDIYREAVHRGPTAPVHRHERVNRAYRPRVVRHTDSRHGGHSGNHSSHESDHISSAFREAYLNSAEVQDAVEADWFSREQAETLYDTFDHYVNSHQEPIDVAHLDMEIAQDLHGYLSSHLHEGQQISDSFVAYLAVYVQRHYGDMYHKHLSGAQHAADRTRFFNAFSVAREAVSVATNKRRDAQAAHA